MKFKLGMQIAVFTKNHRKYLEEATARNAADRVRQTVFRSAKPWTGARAANDALGTLTIYFAPIGGGPLVEYQADLTLVHLNPQPGDPATDEILASELPSTKGEGLWDQEGRTRVSTLYAVSRCEKLDEPFPFTELIKVSDGKPIDKNYGYSYAIVYERRQVAAEDFEHHPEEVHEPFRFIEGATRTVSVNVYERSAGARSACVSHYGHSCIVCGFDFEETYGDMGAGFIHVHHLTPLARVDTKYEVDPVRDLRPVCPNCHAMIHKADPALSVERLKNSLRRPGTA